jgi:hypothetical protein
MQRLDRRSSRSVPEETQRLQMATGAVPLTVRRNRRARRLILRVEWDTGQVTLTLPAHGSVAEALAFARSREEWILGRLALLPPRLPFAEGAMVPVLGVPHQIRRIAEGAAATGAGQGQILVGGPANQVPAAVKRWLRQKAREEVTLRVDRLAARLGRPVGRITLRDPRTRWGSCSSHGHLSFSWRLVMAPADVLDYVTAHEVAHLLEAGHGPRFWQAVRRLTTDIEGPRQWLARHGHTLHRYG